MGGRRRVSKLGRLGGATKIVKGTAQIGLAGGMAIFGPLALPAIIPTAGLGVRNIFRGSKKVFARTGRGTGSGGGQKGHEFYGNQYQKITKYSRGKSSRKRGKRRLSTWKGKNA